MPGKRASEDSRRAQILAAAYRVALRQRVAGLSSRAVAAEAGVSHGLLFFYFRNRHVLLLALLDWLLTQTILRPVALGGDAGGGAAARLAAEVRAAVRRLPEDCSRLELFFDYWFSGRHDEPIRDRIQAALEQCRQSYLPLARAAVAEDPARFRGVTGDALACGVTGFIEGCALQMIADPRRFNAEECAEAAGALLAGSAGPASPTRRSVLVAPADLDDSLL